MTTGGLRRLTLLRPGFPAASFFPPRTYYSNASAAMADRIHRVTMFKMPKEEDRQRMLEQYRQMAKDNQKASSTLAYFITQRPSPRVDKDWWLTT